MASPRPPRSLLRSSRYLTLLAFATLLPSRTLAHGHHAELPEGQYTTDDPIDGILWTHILLMVLSFGLIYPTGMVLGLVRSRWHVPCQILATCIAVVAYFLGHLHKGREFAKPNIHAGFANSLVLMTIVQVGLGVGLKLHLEEKKGWAGRVFGSQTGRGGRRVVVIAHGWLGKLMPVVAWTQMLFGGIVAMGFCRGEHTGQCLAHFIMGSAFIAYGIVMTLMLVVGQAWLRRMGKSQEFFDSIVIAVWGCVNTFTEHRWGGPWVKNDLQHTSMGIVWWCAGLLGIWLSRSRKGAPRRNILPGVVIIMTGWAMSAHPQELPLSTMVHSVFGWTLMAAGASRIVEICFLLKDSRGGSEPSSWQHLPPFLLYASGLLFMGATEEQIKLLSDHDVTHVSYILILYSCAFLMYLFVNILLHFFCTHVWPDDETNGLAAERGPGPRHMSVALPGGGPSARSGRGPMHSRKASTLQITNGHLQLGGSDERLGLGLVGRPNGHVRMPRHRGTDSQQVRDAEEFELEGLIGEEGEGGSPLDSPHPPAGRLGAQGKKETEGSTGV